LSNRLVSISSNNIEITQDNNPAACSFFEKVFDSFKSKNNDMLKLVLDAMMKKLYCDKKKTKVNDNKYEESLSLDEKFECEELASVIMEQMKANAMKLNNNDKGIRFSPQILRMTLSLYIRSPVGYREFKESSLMIFPSERTMERMIAKMRMTDGVCPKTYQWLYDETISAMHDDREKAGHIMCDELQIKSTLCWNTKTHELVGFTSDSCTLDFLSELKALEEYNKEDGQAKNELGDDNIAKKLINGDFEQLKAYITMENSGSTMDP